ncbi:MAG: hypothetical protein NC388_10535 [Clostridium sp.]|nr:hypothetical protein [Clostridium sp.]
MKTVKMLQLMAMASLMPAVAGAQTDMTDKIVNPGYETGTHDGWTSRSVWESPDYVVVNNGQGVYADSHSGNKHMNAWAPRLTSVDVYQEVTLQPGKYRLAAWLRMTDAGHPEYVTDQHVYASVQGVEYKSEILIADSIGNQPQYWQRRDVVFMVNNAAEPVVIGAASTGTGNTPAGWFQADDWTLERLGDVDADEYIAQLQQAFYQLCDEADALKSADGIYELTAVGNMLDAAVADVGNPTTETELIAAMAAIRQAMAEARETVAVREELNKKITECELFAEENFYEPGFDAFMNAIADAFDVYEDVENSLLADYRGAIVNLDAARVVYIQSQAPATIDAPQNVTELYLQLPSFIGGKDYNLPAPWVSASVVPARPQSDIWVGDCRPTSEGGPVRTGLNAWAENFTSMDIYQEITGLPNGVYKVSAEFMMRDTEINDQHIYVASSQGTAVSGQLTHANWDTYTWELVESGYVMVSDGKLRVGAASTCGGGTNGWFQVTNFKLWYGGTDAANVVQGNYEAMTVEADELLGRLMNGDAAVLRAAIEKAASEAAEGNYQAACVALAAPINAAKSQAEAYEAFVDGTVARLELLLLEAGVKSADYRAVLTSARQLIASGLAKADARSVLLNEWVECVEAYIRYADYIDVLNAVLTADAPYAADHLEGTRTVKNEQMARMDAEWIKAWIVDEYIARLKQAAHSLQTSALLASTEAIDATFLIQSPDCQTGNKAWAPEGWDIDNQNGATVTNFSRHWSGDENNYYIDSWHPTAGALTFTASQKLTDIPNGRYTLRAVCSTDGDHVHLFAHAPESADSVFVEFPNDNNIGGEIWKEAEEHYLATGEETPEYLVNNRVGQGWGWRSLEIEVTNHELIIGATCDSTKLDREPFTGTWFSVDDFSLTLISLGDNSDFDNTTGIVGASRQQSVTVRVIGRRIEVEGTDSYEVYDLSGRLMDRRTALPTGIYVVKADGCQMKVVVR